MLDDEDKKAIREWFQRLVRSREAGTAGTATNRGDAPATDDLPLPGDVAAQVKGGAPGGSTPAPPEPPAKSDD